MSKPKVLVLDIETSPIVAYVWGLHDQNIALNQIKNDSFIMAWSAKWLEAPASKIMYQDQRNAKDASNDRKILEPLWKLLDEANIVITQNGQKFDGPRLNARFMLHGMNPPSPYKHLDTYLIVKRVAQFTSNKLEYLTDKFCTRYKKISHGKFPGMSLWKECLKGNKEAWDEMKRYNVLDVLSTEELYLKIRAWAPTYMPSPMAAHISPAQCEYCGSYNLRSLGRRKEYRRYICQHCGKSQQKEAA